MEAPETHLYCVRCAMIALKKHAEASTPGVMRPLHVRVGLTDADVEEVAPDTWQVPCARVIVDGQGVCIRHMIEEVGAEAIMSTSETGPLSGP